MFSRISKPMTESTYSLKEDVRIRLDHNDQIRELAGDSKEITLHDIQEHAANPVWRMGENYFVKVISQQLADVERDWYTVFREEGFPSAETIIVPYKGVQVLLVTSKVEGTSLADEIAQKPNNEREPIFREMIDLSARLAMVATRAYKRNNQLRTTWGVFDKSEATFVYHRALSTYGKPETIEKIAPNFAEALNRTNMYLAQQKEQRVIYLDAVGSNMLRGPDGKLRRIDFEKVSAGRPFGFELTAILDTPVTTIRRMTEEQEQRLIQEGYMLLREQAKRTEGLQLAIPRDENALTAFYAASTVKNASAIKSRRDIIERDQRRLELPQYERDEDETTLEKRIIENCAGRDFHYEKLKRSLTALHKQTKDDIFAKARNELEDQLWRRMHANCNY